VKLGLTENPIWSPLLRTVTVDASTLLTPLLELLALLVVPML
jgi:hypothetical protein